MPNRNAEYIRISLALRELNEASIMLDALSLSENVKGKLYKAIDYLSDRKIRVLPSGNHSAQSPK